MVSLAVVILTHNEERHIGRCLEMIREIAREIFIVDSFSDDRTTDIAEAAGAVVMKNKFINQAKQFEWGLDNAKITSAWVMRLDADEVIEPDLAEEIKTKLPKLESDVVGINFKRKHIFMGRWIRHGGRYPLILLRLWRNGHGRVEDRWMDEHIIVWGGRTETFEGGFLDCNLNDLTFFTEKHNKYAVREAIEVLNQKYELFARVKGGGARPASFQASARRWIKESFYNLLPLGVGPLLYFLCRYIFQLGFLDGRAGFIYHFLQGFWYRFLVSAKVFEFDMVLANCLTTDDRLETLENLTGYRLGGNVEQANLHPNAEREESITGGGQAVAGATRPRMISASGAPEPAVMPRRSPR